MATQRASRIIAALAVIAPALILAAPAFAKSKAPAEKPVAAEPPMAVYVVRSAQDRCEPDCPEWIAAQGQIVPGTLARFKKVWRQLGKRNVPVLVHSGGGLSEEAMAIGHLLHDKGVDVAVAKTAFTPCVPGDSTCRRKEGKTPRRGLPDQDFSYCASSCTFILAAGKRRFVRVPAYVGVHRGEMIMKKVLYTYRMTPYRADDGSVRYKRRLISEKVVSQKHTKIPATLNNKYETYFAEMGIDKEIMPLMLVTPNDSIHWLTGDELRSTRIATHRMSGEQLLRGSAAPDDGWVAAPALPFAPAAPMPGESSQDCMHRGLNCSWDFGHPPLPERAGRGIPRHP